MVRGRAVHQCMCQLIRIRDQVTLLPWWAIYMPPYTTSTYILPSILRFIVTPNTVHDLHPISVRSQGVSY